MRWTNIDAAGANLGPTPPATDRTPPPADRAAGRATSPLRNRAADAQWAQLNRHALAAAAGGDMASLDQQDVDGVRVLRLAGSLTQHGVQGVEPAFESALPDGARAVVDLGQVDLVTTPGITLMLAAAQRLRRTGGRVVFTAARGPVLDLLHRCRLDEVLELAPTEPEAVDRAKH